MRHVLTDLLVFALLGSPAFGQEWLQPYPKANPSYWENVDRLIVRAFGHISSDAAPGETVVFVAAFGPRTIRNTDPKVSQLVGPTSQVNRVNELVEIRFVGHDANGVNLELRRARATESFAECVAQSIGANAFVLSARLYGVWGGCSPSPLDEHPWQALRFPLSATYALSIEASATESIALPLKLSAADSRLHIGIAH